MTNGPIRVLAQVTADLRVLARLARIEHAPALGVGGAGGLAALPPVHAEAMYNPALRASGPRGEIEVGRRE